VPLLDEGAQFVSGDVHSVEVCVAVVSFHLLNLHLHLSPCLIVALVLQITQRYFKYSASETVCCDLLTGCLVARSEGGYSDIKDGGHVNIVPFFSCECVS